MVLLSLFVILVGGLVGCFIVGFLLLFFRELCVFVFVFVCLLVYYVDYNNQKIIIIKTHL